MADAKSEDNNPIVEMTPGQILADTNVSDFIKAMGLSIADAQKALDANSISQVGEYTEPRPGLGGKSLMELGFSPPFYHYEHADLTVSMQLTMKVGRSSSFGIGGKVDFGYDTGGPVNAANARSAEVTVKAMPASVTVDGKQTAATGADIEAAAESLAAAMRVPAGPFEQAVTSSKRTAVKFDVVPQNAVNPIKTETAVVFYPTANGGTGIIRIVDTPKAGTSETFAWADKKTATVQAAANKLLYARAVAQAINDAKDFTARLLRDPGGTTLPDDDGGTMGIALFDTGSAAIKPEAAVELRDLARILKAGGQQVDVVGFTDRMQPDAPNLVLGQQRADAVAQFLKDNGVPAGQINKVETRGEARWNQTKDQDPNAQFRRAEVMLVGSSDLMVIVNQTGAVDLFDQGDKPVKLAPDRTDGSAGNGFIIARKFAGQTVNATGITVGDAATPIGIRKDAASDAAGTYADGSPEAYASNLTHDVNDKSATTKVRATRKGSVVTFASADDAVVITATTLSANDIKLSADGGASVTKPLGTIAAGASATKEKPKIAVAVGLSVDYRTSRQFEQSVNGNSSISARIVSVPAPQEFLDEIKKLPAMVGDAANGVPA